MNKEVWKKALLNWRVLLLIFFIFISIIAIRPSLFEEKGVAVRAISQNSTFANGGLISPNAEISPKDRQVIIEINKLDIISPEQFYSILSRLEIGETFTFKLRDEQIPRSTTIIPYYETKEMLENVTETINITSEEIVNGSLKNITKQVDQISEKLINKSFATNKANLGIKVYEPPMSNIKKGLDLQGGTFALLSPEGNITIEELDLSKNSYEQRLNAFGLSDITVSSTTDLVGNKYIKVEIAGATDEDIVNLLSSQGKFEAKIGSDMLFQGGKDITFVCTTPQCSGINQNVGCQKIGNGWECGYQFSIEITPEASIRQYEVMKQLDIVDSQLSKPIDFYLDNSLASSLPISAGLKGVRTTSLSIQGRGQGPDQLTARDNAILEMKKTQSILQTGSLPVKFNIVSINPVSAKLGNEFFKNAIYVGLLSILVVCLIIFIKYRKLKIALPLLFTSISEVIILLGFYAAFGNNLDLAAIGGIVIAVGTGVDHQIVIIQEILQGTGNRILSWKQKIKNAFKVISAS